MVAVQRVSLRALSRESGLTSVDKGTKRMSIRRGRKTDAQKNTSPVREPGDSPERNPTGAPLSRLSRAVRFIGGRPHSRAPFAFLLAAIAATTAFHVRLLKMPLERDQGEYALAGQLILDGYAPYQRLYNMKWPGTYLLLRRLRGRFR
jgi:hypothetical protein